VPVRVGVHTDHASDHDQIERWRARPGTRTRSAQRPGERSSAPVANRNAEPKHSADRPVSVGRCNGIGKRIEAGRAAVGRAGSFNPEEPRSSRFRSYRLLRTFTTGRTVTFRTVKIAFRAVRDAGGVRVTEELEVRAWSISKTLRVRSLWQLKDSICASRMLKLSRALEPPARLKCLRQLEHFPWLLRCLRAPLLLLPITVCRVSGSNRVGDRPARRKRFRLGGKNSTVQVTAQIADLHYVGRGRMSRTPSGCRRRRYSC
jgi:hypothetical protein